MGMFYFLIKSLNKIKTLSENAWTDTGLTEPLNQAQFEQYGMEDISTITQDQWQRLNGDIEILTWTDSPNDLQIELTTPEFIPLQKLNENGQFEVITWTDGLETPRLQLTVPEYRPYKLLDNPEILSWTDAINPLNLTVSGHKDLTIGSTNPKILVYNDESKTPSGTETGILKDNYYKYKAEIDDTTTPENPDDVLVPLTDWITEDIDSNITIPAGYVNKLNPYNVKVSVEQFNNQTITNSGQILLYNQAPIFILGTVSYNTLSVTIDDPDADTIQYQIMLNGTKIYPEETDWSIPITTPCPVMHKLDSSLINLGVANSCVVNVKDQFGTTASLDLSFIGDYAGLLFTDEAGEYYSTDAGDIIKKLDFGVIIAGFDSDIATIRLINKNYYPVNNIRLSLGKNDIQPYTDVKISKTGGDSFIEQDNLTYSNTLDSGEEVVFYCKIKTHMLATGGSLFGINVKADVVI